MLRALSQKADNMPSNILQITDVFASRLETSGLGCFEVRNHAIHMIHESLQMLGESISYMSVFRRIKRL